MQTASSSDRVSVHHVYHCQQLKSLQLQTMGRRPLPAVRDLALDGRWSTYDVSVLKLYNVRCSMCMSFLYREGDRCNVGEYR